MPTARIAPVVGVVNNVLYVIGGYDAAHPNGYNQVERYDPAGGWTSGLASLPTGRSSGAGGGVINNKIHVFGGVNNNHEISTDEVYDPASNTWSTAPPIPTARFGLGGAVINNNIYAVGGRLRGIATVGQQFIYQITATNHPTSYSVNPNFPLPPGLTLDPMLGVISGVPTTPSFNNQVQVTATNGAGPGSATLAFSVQPSPTPGPTPGPTLVSNTSATGRTGQAGFHFQALAKNASASARFNAGGLPSGITIDPITGLISGTPTFNDTQPHDVTVSLSITDATTPIKNATSNTNLQLTFISDSTPIISSTDSATLVPNQPFSYTITEDTAAPNTTFRLIGTLPPGLHFVPPNTISGVYTGGAMASQSPASETDSDGADGQSVAGSISIPDTHTIRPPLISSIQLVAMNSNGTGTRPLNFFAPISTPSDFNGDSKSDYVLYNAGTQHTALLYLNNNVQIGSGSGPTLPAGWKLIDAADFNGDGKPDYVLFNPGTRRTAIWYMSGAAFVSGVYGPTIASGYELLAAADFNGDGKPDYLLYNPSTHRTAIGTSITISISVAPTDRLWLPVTELADVADFDGDGHLYYALFNPTTRRTVIWYLHENILSAGPMGRLSRAVTDWLGPHISTATASRILCSIMLIFTKRPSGISTIILTSVAPTDLLCPRATFWSRLQRASCRRLPRRIGCPVSGVASRSGVPNVDHQVVFAFATPVKDWTPVVTSGSGNVSGSDISSDRKR